MLDSWQFVYLIAFLAKAEVFLYVYVHADMFIINILTPNAFSKLKKKIFGVVKFVNVMYLSLKQSPVNSYFSQFNSIEKGSDTSV